MKILITNLFFSPIGGAETVSYNTYKILQKNGHEVYFWATDKKPYIDPDYPYQKYFTKDNSGSKNYLKNPFRYFYNKEAAKDLEKLIKTVKPDLIHLNSLENTTSSILDVCKDIPTVLTIHGPILFCPAGTLMLKNKTLCEPINCKNNNYLPCIINNCTRNNIEASIRRSLFLYINNKKLKYINKFITPSEALKNAVINANLGINESQISVVSNFLSNEQLQTKPCFSNRGYFLYIGRLAPEKNVLSILKAIKDLPKEINLHIAGTGPEEENLRNYVKENNLYNVKFLGFLEKESIVDAYQNCIATIIPSNWFEIFGMTNIEAAINGKPTIASNIGGIPEIVEHNKTGLLFEPNNIEDLKKCILHYWDNQDITVEHGKNAYKKAIMNYTEESYYEKLLALYNTVIGK